MPEWMSEDVWVWLLFLLNFIYVVPIVCAAIFAWSYALPHKIRFVLLACTLVLGTSQWFSVLYMTLHIPGAFLGDYLLELLGPASQHPNIITQIIETIYLNGGIVAAGLSFITMLILSPCICWMLSKRWPHWLRLLQKNIPADQTQE